MLQASPENLIRLVKGQRKGESRRQISATPTLRDPPPSTVTTTPPNTQWHFPCRARPRPNHPTINAAICPVIKMRNGWMPNERVCARCCVLFECVCVSNEQQWTPATTLIDKRVRLQYRRGLGVSSVEGWERWAGSWCPIHAPIRDKHLHIHAQTHTKTHTYTHTSWGSLLSLPAISYEQLRS